MSRAAIHRRLLQSADPQRAALLQRYFKTAPGEYAHGDRFLGLTVPAVRNAVREFSDLAVGGTVDLLASPWHEERLLALLLLVRAYERGDAQTRRAVYRAYLDNTARVNNWDLVDASAPRIVGAHLLHRSRTILNRLAKSPLVWDRRIAIMATFAFIRENDFGDSLRIAETLLADEHDLIHKAAGWMLREIGKRNRPAEESFLRRFAAVMPRTMLRYAIERFPPGLRKAHLNAR